MSRRTSIGWIVRSAALALAMAVPALADAPPTPWVTLDIGPPPTPGSTQVDAKGVWTLMGSGQPRSLDSGPILDKLHFACQPVTGDASITAHYLSQKPAAGSNATGSVGLMVRGDDTPGAADAEYSMSTYNTAFWTRLDPEKRLNPIINGGPTNGPAPLFMRLQRAGQEISGFYSRDGAVWFQDVDPAFLPSLPDKALFGLEARSTSKDLYTGRFDQVQVQSGAVLVPWLRSCAGDRTIVLQWRPLSQATGYYIYSGPANARRDQLVRVNSGPVTGTTFTDMGESLANGVPLTYGVTAVIPGPDGTPAEGPLVTVPATPGMAPPGFTGCSLLEGPVSGSVIYDAIGKVLILRGAGFGLDIEGAGGDGGYFLNQPVQGNAQITVRMLSWPWGGSLYEQAVLMIRESLDSGARNVLIGIHRNPDTPPTGLFRSWRSAIYNPARATMLKALTALPATVVLRLTRNGNTITPAYSTDDGKSFTNGAPVTFDPPLAQTLYLGPVVTSGRGGFGARSAVSAVLFDLPKITAQ
jgi:regulation of enolase protein 1 (concanavalin A-like superfamily)